MQQRNGYLIQLMQIKIENEKVFRSDLKPKKYQSKAKLTPRNAKGSEIGVNPVETEETDPRDRVIRRDANEGARV